MLIKNDPDTIKSYFEDSSNLKGGHAEGVVIPEDIRELSDFLKQSSSLAVPVTISGGGTGTTGSRVPFGGMALSMERFNRIIRVSEEERSSLVQAGVLVDDFKVECERRGLFYTSHPTEKTASIGGTIATNASGSRSFKYGPTRDYVKRLKMVLPTGEVMDLRRGEKILTAADSTVILEGGRRIKIPLPSYRIPKVKNSAGYFAGEGTDLLDLFIGQEGTLSVVVEAEIALAARPHEILSAFVFFQKEEDAWQFSDEARSLSRAVSGPIEALSIEYFDANAIRLLKMGGRNIPKSADSAIFFEQELVKGREDTAADGWTKLISKHGVSLDNTWVAMNENQAEEFVGFRHFIPEAMNDIIRKTGFRKLSTDIAVPEGRFMEMMKFYAATLKSSGLEHYVFGHIGECHLHVNLIPRSKEDLAKAEDIYSEFIKKGTSLGGTVSAEHGIGKIKHKYLETMYGAQGIREMARIKKALDPSCILGLDNIFPKELLSGI